jgi:hypothetical protein
MSVQIQVFGQFLDLSPDARIQVSLSSPFFSTDYIAGSLSYEFTLPFTDKNHRILGYIFDEKVSKINQNMPCQLFIQGTPWKDGILYLKRITSKGYQVYVAMDAGLLKEKIAGKDLSEIGLPVIHLKDIGSTDTPFIKLQLNTFVTGKRKLLKLKLYRNVGGVPTLAYQYQVFFDTDKTTTLQALAAQINSKTTDNHLSVWQSGKKYRVPTDFTSKVVFGGTIYTPDFFLNKYWYFINAGSVIIYRLDTPENYTSPTRPIYTSSGRLSFSIVNYSDVDESLGHYDNVNNLTASVSGDEIIIKDGTNAFPLQLATGVDYGPYWTETEAEVETVIQGVSQTKVAAYYESMFDLQWPEAKFAIAPVRNEEFIQAAEFGKYQNNLDKEAKLILNSNVDGSRNKNGFTCFPYVAHVLEGVFNLSSLSIFGDFLQDSELKQLVLWNNFQNDTVLVDALNPANQLRIPNPSINLNHNLKGISITNFLYALRKQFGLDFIYKGNGSVQLVFKKDVAVSSDPLDFDDWSEKEVQETEIELEDDVNGFLFKTKGGDSYYSSKIKSTKNFVVKEDVDEFADLPLSDEVDTVRGVLATFKQTYTLLYRCAYNEEFKKTWVFFGARMEEITVGDGSTTIESEIGVPLMFLINEDIEGRPHWYIPRIDANGRSLFSLDQESTNPEPLKFMFYRGRTDVLFKEGAGFVETDIPWVNTLSQNHNDFEPPFNYSLTIAGEKYQYFSVPFDDRAKGIYNVFWKDWSEMMLRARRVRKKFNLDLLDILSLNTTRKKYVNGKIYLLDTVDFEIGQDDIVPISSDCWRL